MLIIGTTNSTSNLPKWVTERPGRFEEIFEFEITDKDVFEAVVNAMTPETYHGKLNLEELHSVAVENNLTIDAISIQVMNALYRYKKQLADPDYLLKHPYSYIKDGLSSKKFEEPVSSNVCIKTGLPYYDCDCDACISSEDAYESEPSAEKSIF